MSWPKLDYRLKKHLLPFTMEYAKLNIVGAKEKAFYSEAPLQRAPCVNQVDAMTNGKKTTPNGNTPSNPPSASPEWEYTWW